MKPKTNEKLFRNVLIDRAAVDEDGRTVELSFSSEEPVERFFGLEILDHEKKAVRLKRLKRTGPLLMDHNPTDQVGVIESVEIGDDRKGRAKVRFGKSARADEVFRDVLDGIRANVSVGYIIHKFTQEEGSKSGPDIFRATDWEPMEISLVSVPADFNVGVGRAQEPGHDKQPEQRETEMKNFKKLHEADTGTGGGNPAPAPAPQIDIEKERADARRMESERIREITAIAERFKMQDVGRSYIENGKSVELFRQAVLDKLEATPLETPAGDLDMSRNQKQEYSFLRMVRALSQKDANPYDVAPFEMECSREIAKRIGREPQGFFVPYDIPWASTKRGQRDLVVGTDTAGGFMKGTDHLGGEFIDALRDQIVLRSMGARFMTGLKGDVAIPALNAKTAVAWVAENTAPTEGAPTFRQVTMSPKTVAGFVDISRRLMQQSDPSVEQVLRDDMVAQIAAAIDDVGIEGGGANQPTGILQTAGIGSVALGANGADPTWASVVNLIREVAIDNANVGNLWWLTNPKAVAKMRQTVRVATTDSKMIMDEANNMMLGYPVQQTNLVPSDLVKGASGAVCSALIYGNFRELLIGEWGILDVLVDPYSLSSQGATRVTTFMDVDVAVRHAESFAAIVDMLTT